MKLYSYQKKVLQAIADGKHLIKGDCSMGKTLCSLCWAKSTRKDKVLVITTASVRDSCFVAGTMVSTPNGNVAIEDMKVGDEVYAYDGEKIVVKRVKRLINRIDNNPLYRMTYTGSRDIIGTGDHPIYNGVGYTPLKDLKKGSQLYGITCSTSRSKQKTPRRNGKTIQSLSQSSMCNLWNCYTYTGKVSKRPVLETREDVLQSQLFSPSQVRFIAQRQREKVSIQIPRWLPLRLVWQRDYRPDRIAASNISQDQKNILFAGMWKEKESKCLNPVSQEFVQVRVARLTSQTSKVSTGQVCQPQTTRPTEGRRVEKVRVEDIQVLRRGRLRDGSYANQVYCIEVEDCHNFFANGILVHNCGFEREIEKFSDVFSEWYTSLSSFSVVSWSGLVKWLTANWSSLDEYAIIFDEIQRGKAGISSNQGKAMLQICKRTDCWTGWTATPGDKWEDYYAYFTITGKVRNKTDFNNRFCVYQRYPFPKLVAKQNEDEYMAIKSEIWHEVDSSEMEAELPATMHQTVKFKQPAGYKQLMKTHEYNGEFLDNASALAHAARRLCGSKQKLDWLVDFVDGLDGSCIVFYSYETEREAIEKALKGKVGKIWNINGKIHDVPTSESIGQHDVVLAQWQAGAFGLNLQFLQYWISFSPNYSYTISEQARKRIHRKGQTQICRYFYLQCEKTIDEDVYKILKEKKDFDELLWQPS